MTQRSDDPEVTRRFVHPNGTVSHFHLRAGVAFLASVHPEHPGHPALLTRAEILAAWDAMAAEAARDESDEEG